MTDATSDTVYDVVIVGYGPTGMVLGALLGRQGRRVAVIEAHTGLYNLPRAATFDDEIMRTFQKLGAAAEVAEGTLVQTTYEWQNAGGDLLMRHHFDERGRAGWAEWYMMYQPHLEDVLDGICIDLENVEIFRGWRVVGVSDEPAVTAVDAGGDRRVLRGQYIVGCDGGNSFLREALDIEIDDFDFTAPWLVTDFVIRRDLDVPAAMQVCDPAQPTAVIRIGPKHQRFSFMLHPDETVEHATDPDNVWERVSRWVTTDDVELQRIAYYTFRSLVARAWSRGPIFLAGDAAHQMPPFLGQGMCSGIRDAHNLAWKLDLVLSGTAGKTLLETYELERSPHVRAITDKSMELGRIQTLRDPVAARARDAHWIAQRVQNAGPEKLQYPGLAAGLIAADSGHPAAPVGKLFIQGEVETDDGRGLFDDLVGGGFVLITRGAEPLRLLEDEQWKEWSRIGGHTACLTLDGMSPTFGTAVVSFKDLEGVYAQWFEDNDCAAVIVRPDWYVYGTARDAGGLTALLARLGTALH
jgi:2-polyprenyl-6-methoxyphenol hydroxylase-like FAD-dependent oxidoreductase